MKILFLIFGLFMSIILYADWGNEQKLTPSDAAEDMHFGNAVSIDGDYAVIGAIWDDENGICFRFCLYLSQKWNKIGNSRQS